MKNDDEKRVYETMQYDSSFPVTMLLLDHPRYGVDVWDVESKIDYDTALKQGYIELRYIQNAVKFYNQWLNDLYKTGDG